MTASSNTRKSDGRKEIVLHGPRASKTMDKDDKKEIQKHLDKDGFVTVWVHPRIYQAEKRSYKPLRKQGMAMRIFSMNELERLLDRLEKACVG